MRGRGAWGVGRASVPCTVTVIFDSRREDANSFQIRISELRKLAPSASGCLASSSRLAVVSSVQWHSRLGGLALELLCGNSNSLGTVELSGSD